MKQNNTASGILRLFLVLLLLAIIPILAIPEVYSLTIHNYSTETGYGPPWQFNETGTATRRGFQYKAYYDQTIVNVTVGGLNQGINATHCFIENNVTRAQIKNVTIGNDSVCQLNYWITAGTQVIILAGVSAVTGHHTVPSKTGQTIPKVQTHGEYFCYVNTNDYTCQIGTNKQPFWYAGMVTDRNSSTPETIYNIVSLFNTSTTALTNPIIDRSFGVFANWSLEGIPLLDGNCTYNTTNVSAVVFGSTSNFTLTNTTYLQVNHTHSVGSGVTALTQDIMLFRVCRSTLSKNDVQVYVNGVLHRVVDKNLIPLCSAGYHEERNITKDYVSSTSFNVSLYCTDCTPADNVSVLAMLNYENKNFLSERYFLNYPLDSMSYNSTEKKYQSDDLHIWPYSGNFNVSTICNFTNGSSTYGIGSVFPSAFLLDISFDNGTSKEFVNNTHVETGNFSVLGDCGDGEIKTFNISVRGQDGTTVYASSNTSERLNLTSNMFANDSIYRVYMVCSNIYGNTTTIWKNINMTDTALPTYLWVAPSPANTTAIALGNPLNVQFYAFDLNLYSVDIQCFTPFETPFFAQDVGNISSTNIFISNSTMPTIFGTGFCNASVKDAHTLEEIPNLLKYSDSNSMVFAHGDFEVNISVYGVEPKSLKVEKKKDRHIFTPEFNSNPSVLEYVVECNVPIVYTGSNEKFRNTFYGLVQCGDMWIDFNIKGKIKKDYSVLRVYDDKYRITTNNIKKSDVLQTESIGVINERVAKVYFNVVNSSTTSVSVETDTNVSLYLGYGLLCILWIALLFASFLFFWLMLVPTGIYGFFLAFLVLMSFSNTLAIIFMIINGLLIFIGLVMLKD